MHLILNMFCGDICEAVDEEHDDDQRKIYHVPDELVALRFIYLNQRNIHYIIYNSDSQFFMFMFDCLK